MFSADLSHVHPVIAMFAKLSSPFQRAPVVSTSSPDVPERVSITTRREIVMLYDRWTRTDCGGFIKSIKAAIGVLEEIELIENFEAILGVTGVSLVVNDGIRERGIANMRVRLDTHLAEAKRALDSLATTQRATTAFATKIAQPPQLVKYVQGMGQAMERLLTVRRTCLAKIGEIKSFSKQFELIQFYLLILSETSENYVPHFAEAQVGAIHGLFPTTLDGVKEDGGMNIYRID